jgi:hypothetical protein
VLVPGREDPLWRKYTWCCSCSRCGRSYLCVLYGKGIGGAVKLVLVGKEAFRATRSLWDGGSGCWSSFLPISHCASSDAQWNRTHSVSPPRTATSGRSRAKRVERIASCDQVQVQRMIFGRYSLGVAEGIESRYAFLPIICGILYYTAPRAAPSGRYLRFNDAKTRTIDTTELRSTRDEHECEYECDMSVTRENF